MHIESTYSNKCNIKNKIEKSSIKRALPREIIPD